MTQKHWQPRLMIMKVMPRLLRVPGKSIGAFVLVCLRIHHTADNRTAEKFEQAVPGNQKRLRKQSTVFSGVPVCLGVVRPSIRPEVSATREMSEAFQHKLMILKMMPRLFTMPGTSISGFAHTHIYSRV